MQPDGTNVQQIIRDSAASSPSFRQPRSALDLEQALKDFAPQIRYDEQESFFADSAGEMTDNPGNSLQREDSSVIASSSGLPPNQLSLGFLASPTYANGATVIESDFLDASDDYEIDAQQMHSNPLYANQIYGHAYRKNDRWWLQYWFFYYYNPQEVLGVGVHEGDWEGIQLELDTNGTPVSASYAQHNGGQSCAWDEIERIWIDDRVAPVVYSARASHASYFFPGVYRGGLDPLPDDYATGTGLVANPEVTGIDDALPTWITWPGSWGASGNSPPGPKFNGERWIDPQSWAASLDGCPSGESLSMADLSAASVPVPKIDLERQGNEAYIAYQFPEWPSNSDAQPRMLVISIDPAGHSEAGLPYTAITRSYPVASDHGEVVMQPLGLGTAPYVVRVSAFSEGGARSEVISQVMK